MEIELLIPYNDLMEQALVYADEIKAAVGGVSNDEVLGNMVANAAVNKFMGLNK